MYDTDIADMAIVYHFVQILFDIVIAFSILFARPPCSILKLKYYVLQSF